MVEFPTALTGRSFNSGTVLGLKFARTSYSKVPILGVPDGAIRHGHELRSKEVPPEVVQLLLGEPASRQAQLQNWGLEAL